MPQSLFNLPKKVTFCKECVMSNQKPHSVSEFKHTFLRKGAKYMKIDDDGVCSACKVNKLNNSIDWNKREKELSRLLDKFRKNNGEFDCLVPGSGGKDSAMVSHVLKYKYGMNPLTCTWQPVMYTDYGYENYKRWLDVGGFENIVVKPNGYVMKYLTQQAILNLLHPFQTFILGQKNIAPKIALKFNINLIFYGESDSLYGSGNPKDFFKPMMSENFFSTSSFKNLRLSGMKVKDILKDTKIKISDLKIFFPLSKKQMKNKKIEFHYFGYYQKWIPQEIYYYAFNNTGFRPRPFRSQGTFQKYSSIDDKIDDLHFYTQFIKFGFGRATVDCCQEIRNKYLTRSEAIRLVKKYDGEFPNLYFNEIMDYLNIDKQSFFRKCDESRSPHLWKKKKNNWILKNTVYGEEKKFPIIDY